MHTVIVLAVGFGLFALSALVGRILGYGPGVATAALVFLPLWFVGAGINMYMGVKRGGYSVAKRRLSFSSSSESLLPRRSSRGGSSADPSAPVEGYHHEGGGAGRPGRGLDKS